MKRLVLVTYAVISFLPLTLWAQDRPSLNQLRDSLTVFESQNGPEGYSRIILDLAEYYQLQNQIDSAVFYLQKGLDFMPDDRPRLKDRLQYNLNVQRFVLEGQNPEKISYLDSAYHQIKRFGEDEDQIAFFDYYAQLLRYAQLPKRSYSVLKEMEQLCLKRENTDYNRLVGLYNDLQIAARDQGLFEEALDYVRKGIEAGKKSDDFSALIRLYIDNGSLLGTLELDGEFESYQKAAELAETKGTERDRAVVNISLAYYRSSLNQPQRALDLLRYSKAVFTRLEEPDALITVQREMANAYHSMKDFRKAIELMDACITECERQYQTGCQFIYSERIHYGDTLTPPDSAIAILKQQLELSKSLNDQFGLANAYEQLSHQAKRKGDYRQALFYFEETVEIRDSLSTENLDARMAEERTKQQVEDFQAAKEKAELENQVLTTRYQLFGAISLALLLILAAGGYLFRQLSITRKKLADKNLRLSQLNDTKDRFFGIIAHDIRSPITALDGVGEQMEFYLKKQDTGKLKRLAERVDSTSKKLTNLLDNLLNWALLQKGMIPYHPKAVNVHDIVEENIELYRDVADLKDITLENKVEKGVEVYADLSAVSTIIRNLINNAVKFTKKGGRVSVSTEVQNERVQININDTGTGIGAERLEKIFTLNKTRSKGTANEKGAGLGLILCKDLVELNKGTITAISELGKGSSFIFSLPVS